MPVLQRSKIITLTEACKILGISYDYGCRIYHLWPKYGVQILKHTDNARPRFYEEEIYKMMEAAK